MNGWSESGEVESPPDANLARTNMSNVCRCDFETAAGPGVPPLPSVHLRRPAPRFEGGGHRALAGLDGCGVVRNAADVIDRESAVRAVETQLERDYQRWRAMDEAALRMTVVDVEEHALVWIVHWTSETFVRTGDPAFMLAGNGPYLVDRVDGGLHEIGVVSSVTGAWEDDYRGRIRGLPVRTAVDDLHDALRDVAVTRGRMHAVRTLRRRVPVLSPAEAIEYVSALLEGDVPARLVAVSTRELVEPLNPVYAVKTVLSGAETPGDQV
ncbi:YrhB domain-containing protein [Streptomyces anulatus]